MASRNIDKSKGTPGCAQAARGQPTNWDRRPQAVEDCPSVPNIPSRQAHIVHLVGELTPVVLSYLQPATRALDAAGFAQHVVVVCKEAPALPLPDFGERTRVEWVTSRSSLHRWSTALAQLNSLLVQRSPDGVHLHGFVPFCLGGVSLRRAGYQGRLYYSPHGSRAHGKHGILGCLAYALVSPCIGGSSFLMIADSVGDPAAKLPGHTDVVEAVANPVDDGFLNAAHIDASEAMVIGGSTESNDAELHSFIQMVDRLPRRTAEGKPIRFCWMGPVQSLQHARLKAAGIAWAAHSDQHASIALLGAAWVFLAPIGGRGYPLLLAQAMASGTPCVALRCTEHALLIEDRKDGMLFDNHDQAKTLVEELLNDAGTRNALGKSARQKLHATRRPLAFAGRVLPLYQDSHVMQAPSQAPA